MKNILFIFLSVFILASCTKETGVVPDEENVVYLDIVPTVASSVTAEVTRAKVNGVFPANSRIGLSIATTPLPSSLHAMYTNFYSIYNGTSWGYYLDNTYNGTLLSGFKTWGDINVMGYYPYDNTVSDLSAIPFHIADVNSLGIAVTEEDRATVDYMVAGTETKNMLAGAGNTVSLSFDHLMTSISFYVRRSYQGPQIKLSKVKFEIDGTRYFDVSGTYNAVSPNMSALPACLFPIDRVQTLEVTYSSSEKTFTHSTTHRETALLILPELKQTEADLSDDANVTMTFYFTDAFGSDYTFDTDGNPKVSFKLSDITNAVGTKGFLTGRNYRITAEIGTYIHFEGVPVVVEKDLDNNTDPTHIEI